MNNLHNYGQKGGLCRAQRAWWPGIQSARDNHLLVQRAAGLLLSSRAVSRYRSWVTKHPTKGACGNVDMAHTYTAMCLCVCVFVCQKSVLYIETDGPLKLFLAQRFPSTQRVISVLTYFDKKVEAHCDKFANRRWSQLTVSATVDIRPTTMTTTISQSV